MIIADSMTHRFAVPIMLGAEATLGEIHLSMITCDARANCHPGTGTNVSSIYRARTCPNWRS